MGINLHHDPTSLPPVELNCEMRSLRLAFAQGLPSGRHEAKARQKQSSAAGDLLLAIVIHWQTMVVGTRGGATRLLTGRSGRHQRPWSNTPIRSRRLLRSFAARWNHTIRRGVPVLSGAGEASPRAVARPARGLAAHRRIHSIWPRLGSAEGAPATQLTRGSDCLANFAAEKPRTCQQVSTVACRRGTQSFRAVLPLAA